MIKAFSSAMAFVSLSLSLTIFAPVSYAQTTNPELNDLLRGLGQIQRDTDQFNNDLMLRDQQLRVACWQGSQAACVELDNLLINPNLNPSGIWVTPPAGAYWPFDPNGIPLY
jgi:hypothetical protein